MSVSSLTIWGPPSGHASSLTIGGPLRSISLHTIWGPLQISFFAYYMGASSDLFLRILYGGPLRSVSSLTKWGPLRSVSSHTILGPLNFFYNFYGLNYPWGAPIFFNFQGGGASAPSPAGTHVQNYV